MHPPEPVHRSLTAVAAVALLATTALLAGCGDDDDDDATADGEIAADVLLDGHPAGPTWAVTVANTTAELDALWAELEIDLDMEPIDLDTTVVIHYGPAASSSCPFDDLVAIRHDPSTERLYPDLPLEGDPPACTDDANPHAVVVAIERADLPDEAFTVWVENADPPSGVAGAERRVDAGELAEPPTTG